MTIAIILPSFIIASLFLFKKRFYVYEEDTLSLSFIKTDILRAAAILMVILMHTSCAAGARIFTPLGGTGVAIFLILSGYGLSLSEVKKGIDSFWKNKIVRIFIPYSIFILISLLISGNYGKIFTIDFILDILCLKSSYWYVSFLIYNYALFWLCNYKKTPIKIKYSIFLLFGLALLLFDYRIRAEQALSFPTGMLLADFKNIRNKLNLKNQYITYLFIFSFFLLLLKQIPYLRSIYINHRILINISELFMKYGFALYFITIINTTPPVR